MKKKINKKKMNAPSYAFGLAGALGAGQLLGGITEMFTAGKEDKFGKPSGAQIGVSTASGALSGGAAGLTVGGPIGAGVGALLGGGLNLIKGNKQKREAQEAQRRYNSLSAMNEGYNNTALLEQNYYENNPLALTYENGGIIPDNLAYLDNNEMIRDVYGNISEIPNTTIGADNHLVDATTLESVVSDKIKYPGTKITMADKEKQLLGKLRKPSKKRAINDKYAQGRDEAQAMIGNVIHNHMLDVQESEKNRLGIKDKVKEVPAYQNGLKPVMNTFPITEAIAKFGQNLFNTPAYPDNRKQPGVRYQVPISGNLFTPNRRNAVASLLNPQSTQTPVTSNTTPQQTVNTQIPNALNTTPIGIETNPLPIPDILSSNSFQSAIINPITNPTIDESIDLEQVDYGTEDPTTRSLGLNFDYNNILSSIGSLTPTIYNAIQSAGRSEVEDPVRNPYTSAISRTLARRRFNTQPIVEANRRSRAIGNYNAGRYNPNTGANLAFRTQTAASEYAANADLEATRQNTNNQYLADYAATLNNLGQQSASSIERTRDINAANRAAKRNYGATAASQIGQWWQVQQQMRNQGQRDDMVWPLLSNFLSQGYDSQTIQDINNTYYKGGLKPWQ